jgi:4-amino-4-deoxy-L-arabinose transferase-like glycosyltransferase
MILYGPFRVQAEKRHSCGVAVCDAFRNGNNGGGMVPFRASRIMTFRREETVDFGKSGIFFILAALFICVFLNNDLPTVNNMEARNYVTAREILQDGSWLLPTLNGELRIAKPPLPTWITAVAMKWAGTDANLGVNRIPAGICGALLALFTFLLIRRVTGNQGLAVTAVLVLATGFLFFWSARRNFWDIYAHMSMTGAVWAMAEIFVRKQGKGLYILLFSLFMAFSFFSKGPVALWAMFIPFLTSYCLVYGMKDLKKNSWRLVPAIGIAVLLSAIWPVYVYLNTPHEALAVASRETANWFTYHREPPWYYLLNLHWVAGLWLFFLLYAVIAPFIEKNWKQEEKLFVFWFILTIVLLSVVPEKKIRYLLPAIVPGAAISAVAIYRLRESGGRAWKAVYGPFCIITGILFFAAAGALAYHSPGMPVLIPGALALAVTGGVIVSGFIRKRTGNTHLIVMTGLCLCLVLIDPLKPVIMQKDDTLTLMSLREIPELQGRDLYFLGDPPAELIWAAGRKVRPMERDRVAALRKNSPPAALMTAGAMDEESPGMRLVNSMPTREINYHIYCILQERTE